MSDASSSILGLGNDIIEIERIRESIKEHGSRFLERLFTPKEQAYCLKHEDSATHFAGRFAAKEAISKALGLGVGRELAWKDMEILNDENGTPQVTLSQRFKNMKVLVSISHCKHYATAVAIRTN